MQTLSSPLKSPVGKDSGETGCVAVDVGTLDESTTSPLDHRSTMPVAKRCGDELALVMLMLSR
jgi:hypothetical protein